MNTVEIRAVNEDDNFIKIAECIYCTDPFIYPTAFGEEKKSAAFAIAELMKVHESVLYYQNMIIATLNDKVCGVLLYNEHGAEWNTEEYYNRVKGYIPSKEKFEYASFHYFLKEAKKPAHNHIEVIAVCVNSAYRQMGVASAMLGAFVEEKRNSILELDVLSGNESAVQLYSRYGFTVTEHFKGFSLTEETRPDCYHMIRV